MSEVLVVEDDPDPLPADEFYGQSTLRASETLLAERELAIYERDAVSNLSMVANRILSSYQTIGEDDDCRVVSGGTMLRRRNTERDEAGRMAQVTSYFYVDKTAEPNYCRSWSARGEQVNWCLEQERHEPADDVRVKIEQAFPLPSSGSIKLRLANRVLAKLRRR